MRIPLPIAILILLLGVAGLWWLRTRKMDFMEPSGTTRPLPEFMAPPAEGEHKPPAINLPSRPDPDKSPPDPTPPARPVVEFGDLESAPGLAEYSEHASKGPAYLIQLATELETAGHFPRALLAWERVLDSTSPSADERKIAEDAILRIRPTLPRWNVDPQGDVGILLQLRTPKQASANLKTAAREVADLMRRDSDDTIAITPRFTTSLTQGPRTGTTIAVHFSETGRSDSPRSSSVSITPADDAIATHRTALLTACFQIVRQSVEGKDGIQPIPAGSHPDSPAVDFQRKITRLHWKFLSESLTQSPPPETRENAN